jgi:predicted amidohydrolase
LAFQLGVEAKDKQRKKMFTNAVVQFNPIRKNVQKNILTIESLLSNIKADLVVLPELANSGYLYEKPGDLEPYAENSDGNGPFLTAMKNLAKKIQCVIVCGYAEVDSQGLFNASAAVTADGVLLNYRKTHLYSKEKDLFLPGDTGFSVFEWKQTKIGMMICFDWIFPESCRSLALLGVQVIAHPSNLVLPYCQDAMVTRSIENRVFTITANRIGQESLGKETLKFTGKSQITDIKGKVLYRGPSDKSAVHITSIDPELAKNKAINSMNDLFEDRRPDRYRLD